MVTIDAHLHLGQEHVPQWWVDELYAPFGDVKYDSADGQVIWTSSIRPASTSAPSRLRTCAGHRSIRIIPASIDTSCPTPTWPRKSPSSRPARGEAAIDPFRNIQAAVLELDRCVNELGFKGLKLVPTYQQYSPSDPRLDPMYEKCIELDIPCHIHMGGPRPSRHRLNTRTRCCSTRWESSSATSR